MLLYVIVSPPPCFPCLQIEPFFSLSCNGFILQRLAAVKHFEKNDVSAVEAAIDQIDASLSEIESMLRFKLGIQNLPSTSLHIADHHGGLYAHNDVNNDNIRWHQEG